METPAASHRENCFDALRLFAAVCVLVYHAHVHLERPFLWLGRGNEVWFTDGVALFFILSGLLVYQSADRCARDGRPWRQFFANRFLRVAPAIYAYALVTVAFLGLIGALAWPALASMGFLAWLASTFALVPVYHPEAFRHIGVGVLNGSLWTIPAECGFYLIVPLLVLVERRFGFRTMAVGLALVAAAGSALHGWLQGWNPELLAVKLYTVTFLPYLVYFGLGVWWARMWRRVPHSGLLAAACVGAYCLVMANPGGQVSRLGPAMQWAAAVPLSYAVVWFGYNGPRAFQRLSRIGDMSYGVYIWHMVVVNVVLWLGVRERLSAWPPDAAVGLVLLLSLALAYASWHLVEKRALRLKPFSSRAPRPAVPEGAAAGLAS